MPRGAAGQFAPLQQHNVFPSTLGKIVRDTTPNHAATNDDGDHHRDDGDRPPEKAGRARGRRKREAGILQDARRVLKLLGEKEAGGNKTD